MALHQQTLKQVTGYITDVIMKRAEHGKNYGVILIPEGLIDFIPEARPTLAFYLIYILFCCQFYPKLKT